MQSKRIFVLNSPSIYTQRECYRIVRGVWWTAIKYSRNTWYSRVYIWHILCINFASRYKKCVKNITLQWRHTERDGDSNHHCLLNRLFRRRSKKTSKLRVTGLWPLKWPVTRKMFPLDDVIMPKPSAELTPLLLDDAITLWKRCRSVVLTMIAPLLRYLTN